MRSVFVARSGAAHERRLVRAPARAPSRPRAPAPRWRGRPTGGAVTRTASDPSSSSVTRSGVARGVSRTRISSVSSATGASLDAARESSGCTSAPQRPLGCRGTNQTCRVPCARRAGAGEPLLGRSALAAERRAALTREPVSSPRRRQSGPPCPPSPITSRCAVPAWRSPAPACWPLPRPRRSRRLATSRRRAPHAQQPAAARPAASSCRARPRSAPQRARARRPGPAPAARC